MRSGKMQNPTRTSVPLGPFAFATKACDSESVFWVSQYSKLTKADDKIVYQAHQRVIIGQKCVIATNDNNMMLVAHQKGTDCLKIRELTDYIFNYNGENAQLQPPSVWVARNKSRAAAAMEAEVGATTALPSTPGGIRWIVEPSDSRPGMQKYHFKWPGSSDHLCINNGEASLGVGIDHRYVHGVNRNMDHQR